MNLRPATSDPSAPTWGSFALVTYLPDPLGSFLTELRHLLPGAAGPEAHITFLPPRPLALPLEIASDEIRRILASVKPFIVELGKVRVFPETNILYLSVATGHDELLQLHDLLNRGDLFAREHFEYIPHLTLGGPLASDDVAESVRCAQDRWENSGLSPRFVVNEMVLLWQPDNCLGNEWDRISAHPLTQS
jgi:2'-5' RNA ligase